MWRPKEWGKIKKEVLKPHRAIISECSHDEDAIFEAGADAMLEALFKLAEESPTKTFVIDSQVIQIYRSKYGC